MEAKQPAATQTPWLDLEQVVDRAMSRQIVQAFLRSVIGWPVLAALVVIWLGIWLVIAPVGGLYLPVFLSVLMTFMAVALPLGPALRNTTLRAATGVTYLARYFEGYYATGTETEMDIRRFDEIESVDVRDAVVVVRYTDHRREILPRELVTDAALAILRSGAPA
ncbi:hypothetical protein GV794_28675 [Nocardia cyriacigeorgica]|uniref:Uncharacterized protein n=1 Tax=Nocardia cyriacigeorgica TaxID=135487 RepID=A0A6P1DFK8_9NOCA|nr:hypothetical protein [Nocardia cyriacigeorgica]NEW39844.1 hypothetical protein [Nocardia cyriacigeorgica]NEW48299.1 hypothetical protein [Nocardia cyriacigeorgica]NEW59569.1 hypothetical protein [Nocardia cyriacigeorgica]